MSQSVEKLLRALSLKEKCGLLSGVDAWNTRAVGDVPSIRMHDGPNGLRATQGALALESDPATCFPTESAVASTWDRARAANVGGALGAEAAAKGVNLVLAPGVNIKRSPLGGRNFEYMSEDPFLTGEMAKSYVNAMQDTGVGCSLKHFAVNNQETNRMNIDAIIDDRTLREIYLPAFETVIKECAPWTVMIAYNRLVGPLCTENRWLMHDLLREEWGYEGVTVSDWGAVSDRPATVAAGLDLEMPGFVEHDDAVLRAVESGKLSEELVDVCVRRLIELILLCKSVNTKPGECPPMLNRRIAAESIVLLKNDGGLLPLIPAQRVCLIGPFGMQPIIQGGGSSRVNPSGGVDVPLEEMRVFDPPVTYAQGFRTDGARDEALLKEAVVAASKSDVAVIIVGLPEGAQSEGVDRPDLALPAVQNALVDAVSAVQSNVVVVLMNGGPVLMPWLSKARALLMVYPCGQRVGGALADVLYGVKEPSGRLAETFPERLEDTPCFMDFPGGRHEVRYSEGVFVGYRWYDARKIAPLFPFGHGLNYTSFAYSDLEISQNGVDVDVSVKVTNTGRRVGRAVVQLYVAPPAARQPRPVQELKGFAKIRLGPGESGTVHMTLNERSFAYYDHGWVVEAGRYELRVGFSSRNIALKASVDIASAGPRHVYTRHDSLQDFLNSPAAGQIKPVLEGFFAQNEGQDLLGMDIKAIILSMPIRAVATLSGGAFTEAQTEDIINLANS